MTVRPVTWNLRQITAEAQTLHEGVAHLFAHAAERHAVQAAMHGVLAQHVGPDVVCFLESIESRRFGEVAETCNDQMVTAVLGLSPGGGRLFVLMDAPPAGLVIDRLLGGDGSRGGEPTPFTETELGVLQFLLMQGLAAVHVACGAGSRYHFRFERFVTKPAALRDLLPPRESMVVATWRCGAGTQLGLVRLLLTRAFVEQAVAQTTVRFDAAAYATAAARFSATPVTLRIEAGHCELTAPDLAGLEPGDVVLLEHAQVHLEHGVPAGTVALRPLASTQGAIQCAVSADDPGRGVVRGVS